MGKANICVYAPTLNIPHANGKNVVGNTQSELFFFAGDFALSCVPLLTFFFRLQRTNHRQFSLKSNQIAESRCVLPSLLRQEKKSICVVFCNYHTYHNVEMQIEIILIWSSSLQLWNFFETIYCLIKKKLWRWEHQFIIGVLEKNKYNQVLNSTTLVWWIIRKKQEKPGNQETATM